MLILYILIMNAEKQYKNSSPVRIQTKQKEVRSSFIDNRPGIRIQAKLINDIQSYELLIHQKRENITGFADGLKTRINNLSGFNVDDARGIPLQMQGVYGHKGLTNEAHTIQLAKNTLQLEAHQVKHIEGKEAEFEEYLTTIEGNYDRDSHKVTTVRPIRFVVLLSKFQKWLNEQKEPEIDPREKKERSIALGEQAIKSYAGDRPFTRLTQEGKNNLGIYEIITPDPEQKNLIVKVVGDNYSNGRLTEIQTRTDVLKDIGEVTDIKLEINNLKEFHLYTKDGITIYLLIYEKQGLMNLEDALKYTTLPSHALALSAEGMATRIAHFHISPIIKMKKEMGKFLVHKDLNTTNIMLDLNGVLGLIDSEDMDLTDEPLAVRYDLASIRSSIRLALTNKYLDKTESNAVEQEMWDGFKRGYISVIQECARSKPEVTVLIPMIEDVS